MGQKAVVYFSRNGSTRLAAEILAERLGAKLVELKELKPRRNFLISGFRGVTKKHSKLSGDPSKEIEDCNTLVLAAPIWAGQANPAMNGFLDMAVLTGKIIYILTIQADPGHAQSDEVLNHYADRVKEAGGSVVGRLALTGASPGKTAKEKDLRTALDGWRIE
ncbi:MAG: NAD(P)H-dependent oxidoreductase [Spirochaetia bacterium]